MDFSRNETIFLNSCYSCMYSSSGDLKGTDLLETWDTLSWGGGEGGEGRKKNKKKKRADSQPFKV